MRSLFWIPIAFVLVPGAIWPQALPDAPAPAALNPQWIRIQQISDGQQIVVRTTKGEKVRCSFAGATETCLFCDPPGVLSSQPTYRFDRGSLMSVREARPESDAHPIFLASMAVLGTIVGAAATRTTDDKTAAWAGLLTAGVLGATIYPFVEMQSQGVGFGFPNRPRQFGFNVAAAAWSATAYADTHPAIALRASG